MTDDYWQVGTDPHEMLYWLKPNRRKTRLFACACCRHIWLFLDEARRNLIEASELFADGLIPLKQLKAAMQAAAWNANMPFDSESIQTSQQAAVCAAGCAAEGVACSFDSDAPFFAALAVELQSRDQKRAFQDQRRAFQNEREYQCSLIRDIFGNPYHRAPKIKTSWLSSKIGCVPAMAQAIYEERQFGDLPILADALEDAGCESPEILTHCRAGREHVRGCWVVDLILGKT
jgi:hypothetical protein